jgi:hypothetical protein
LFFSAIPSTNQSDWNSNLFIISDEILKCHFDWTLDQSLNRKFPVWYSIVFDHWYWTMIAHVKEVSGREEALVVKGAEWCLDIEWVYAS